MLITGYDDAQGGAQSGKDVGGQMGAEGDWFDPAGKLPAGSEADNTLGGWL